MNRQQEREKEIKTENARKIETELNYRKMEE